MTDVEFSLQTNEEVAQELARRAKELRIHKNISQESFSKKAGISYHTYSKFERTGKISLEGFINIMRYLGRLNETNKLLILDDIEKIGLEQYSKVMSGKKRQRASSKK